MTRDHSSVPFRGARRIRRHGRTVIVWLAAGSLVAAAGSLLAAVAVLVAVRGWIRCRRHHVRLLLVPYRTDRAGADAAVEALHAAIVQRWWRRLLAGQASVALELHRLPGRSAQAAALAMTCPPALHARVEAAQAMRRVAERDAHEGCFVGYALPTRPPEVRVDQADGDATARGRHPRLRPVLPDAPE